MGPNPKSKARIVARIKPDSFEVTKQPWISVTRPDKDLNPNIHARVKISFHSEQITSAKQNYEVDECYGQDVGNEEIFSKEIEHLISGIFEGHNSTVFAYGPQSSGKTFTIQGSEEKYGLVALTIDSILPRAQEKGIFIAASVFQVYQDRVIDLLDSKSPEVSVFDDGQGKIRLKGLSKVKVDSTLEFQKLYCGATNTLKTMPKLMLEPLRRSHIGCIIHVVTAQSEKTNPRLVGKINFIDLASYGDSRRKSIDGPNIYETARINKSLYAVHNVLYALNANEIRVPFRESKLTRMLQDSLGGSNKALMISFMNPYFCPNTLQAISLASQSCQAGFLACLDPGRSKSGSKIVGLSSPQVSKLPSMRSTIVSPKVMKPLSTSASGKKQTGSQLRTCVKKPSGLKPEVKGRILFDETKLPKNLEQESMCPESSSHDESCALKEATICPESASARESSDLNEDKLSLTAAPEADTSQRSSEKDVAQVENVTATPTYQTPIAICSLPEGKENNKSSFLNKGASPPLSARLREISNNLKSLCISSESSLKMAQDNSFIIHNEINESMEPKTPTVQPSFRGDDKFGTSNMKSPWESFQKRGSMMKDSVIHDFLTLLNSGSKDELKGIKGIGDKRSTYIIEKREETPEPFRKLDDLKDIGLSEKQIKGILKNVAGELFI